jgi:hypothetical protein
VIPGKGIRLAEQLTLVELAYSLHAAIQGSHSPLGHSLPGTMPGTQDAHVVVAFKGTDKFFDDFLSIRAHLGAGTKGPFEYLAGFESYQFIDQVNTQSGRVGTSSPTFLESYISDPNP